MRPNTNPANKPRSCLSIFVVVGLCCFCYAFGSWQQSGFGSRLKSGYGKGDTLARAVEKLTDCTLMHVWNVSISEVKGQEYKPCDAQYTDYTPCQDENRAMKFPRESMIYRERHCPPSDEKLSCLVPAPKGYLTPFHWPISCDYVPYANVPHKSLTVEKAVQNWLQIKGNVFKFPGGGTMFPQGADAYIDQLASIIPIADGTVRTALDTGCGVASWGAYLLKRNVIAMSFAPRDSHEAQVQFALERGVPAVIGVLGTIRLPYPSRAFDMAHCSRCLIPWASNDGMYLMEVDRVLRPGGYWVLSGPPINWRNNYQAWQRSKDELEKEQRQIEELAELLCWEKVHEKANLAIWRKKINAHLCKKRQDSPQKRLCQPGNPDDVWYKEMVPCITPYPDVSHPDEVAGGALKKFPERLSAVAPRIASSSVPGISADLFVEDMKIWRKHVNAYKRMNKYIGTVRYRNIMDMNAGFGSFAAELESNNSWVMNVVPTIADKDTLGVIYERGLIGIYHDWCEAFSTYPRTYDLIHANGVFSLFQDKCNMEDILLEMDRILRPEGAVIFRDNVDILNKVKTIVSGMRWNTKLVDHEDGPESSERILLSVKRYWTLETEA